jgi:hypothetical protein
MLRRIWASSTGEPPHASRTARATPLGRPPGLPDSPGRNGLPIRLTVPSLFSAGSLTAVRVGHRVLHRLMRRERRVPRRSGGRVQTGIR